MLRPTGQYRRIMDRFDSSRRTGEFSNSSGGLVMDTQPSFDRQSARVLAFYLPQFHQVPENDRWWGEGFTEWTNVKKARPLFSGHHQPRHPGELGYYDLRNPEIRQRQADLARASGIEGFCYWHYWFGDGDRMLELPVNEIMRLGEPDYPFCLCWANESWSGVWHGAPRKLLKEQRFPGLSDYTLHFEAMLPVLEDKRYLRVDGKPLFLVYKPHLLPSSSEFIDHWRMLAQKHGLPGIHFIGMDGHLDHPSLLPFDQVTPTAPSNFVYSLPKPSYARRLLRRIASGQIGDRLGGDLCKALGAPQCYQYSAVIEHAMKALPKDRRHLPCIVPNWDNTPRVGRRGVVLENATPELFRKYLRQAADHVSDYPASERFIFIKAWNEWAEGNFIEPAQDTGTSYLDVIQQELCV